MNKLSGSECVLKLTIVKGLLWFISVSAFRTWTLMNSTKQLCSAISISSLADFSLVVCTIECRVRGDRPPSCFTVYHYLLHCSGHTFSSRLCHLRSRTEQASCAEAIKLSSCKMQKEVQLFCFKKFVLKVFPLKKKTDFETPKGIQQHGERRRDAEKFSA